MSGFFPPSIIRTFGSGFFGPVKKTAAGTLISVTPAAFVGGTVFGTVIGLSLSFNVQIFAVHTMLVADPGSDVGTRSPTSLSGNNIVGVANFKVGSPINGYMVFAGAGFAVPGGVTWTYTDASSIVRTETPVLVDLSANLGAGFTSWRAGFRWGGTSNGNSFTVQFNGI
jgi:hypothetical protein